jgi:hypothetical protein
MCAAAAEEKRSTLLSLRLRYELLTSCTVLLLSGDDDMDS